MLLSPPIPVLPHKLQTIGRFNDPLFCDRASGVSRQARNKANHKRIEMRRVSATAFLTGPDYECYVGGMLAGREIVDFWTSTASLPNKRGSIDNRLPLELDASRITLSVECAQQRRIIENAETLLYSYMHTSTGGGEGVYDIWSVQERTGILQGEQFYSWWVTLSIICAQHVRYVLCYASLSMS